MKTYILPPSINDHYVSDTRCNRQFSGTLAACRAWIENQRRIFTVFGFPLPTFCIYYHTATEPAEIVTGGSQPFMN